MLNLQPWIDDYGLIVQSDKDGGDTLQRMGMYYYALKILGEDFDFEKQYITIGLFGAIVKLEPQPGIYIRHPDPDKWYSNPKTTSRDQMISFIIAITEYGLSQTALRVFKSIIRRFGFAQNTMKNGNHKKHFKIPDIFLPHHFALFIRGLRIYELYPLLLFTDLFLLADVCVHVAKSHYLKNEFSDDLNLFLILHQSKLMPTPISLFAKHLYKRFRWRSHVWAFLNYFRPETGAPPFFDLYLPLLYSL